MNGLVQTADPEAIDKAIARMAVAFQREIDGATMRVYRDTLADLPLWAIEAGELHLRRKGGTFFPSAALWHQVADEAIQARTRESLAQPDRGELYECEGCRDTGWVEESRDDRTVMLPCSCRPRNTRYQRMTAASCRSRNEDVKREAH